MTSSRQLSAIMFTDIVGYTDMMQRDEPSMPSFVMNPLFDSLKYIPEHRLLVNPFDDKHKTLK